MSSLLLGALSALATVLAICLPACIRQLYQDAHPASSERLAGILWLLGCLISGVAAWISLLWENPHILAAGLGWCVGVAISVTVTIWYPYLTSRREF